MSAGVALAAVAAGADILADAPNGKAGPVALFVIVLLCIAAAFLFRSMSRHLRQVPKDFAPPTPEGAVIVDDAQPAPPTKAGDPS
jgi:hypothetical protein